MPTEVSSRLSNPSLALAEITSLKRVQKEHETRDKSQEFENLISKFKTYGDDSQFTVTERDRMLTRIVSYGIVSLFSDIRFYLALRSQIFEQSYKQPIIACLILKLCERDCNIIDPILKFLISELQFAIQKMVQPTMQNHSNMGSWTEIKLLLRFTSLLSPILSLQNILYLYRTVFTLSELVFEHEAPQSDWYHSAICVNAMFLFFFDQKNKILLFEVINFIESMPDSPNSPESKTDLLEVFCFQGNRRHSNDLSPKDVKDIFHQGLDQLSKIFPDWCRTIRFSEMDKYTEEIHLELPTLPEIKRFYKRCHCMTTVDKEWCGYNNDFVANKYPSATSSQDISTPGRRVSDYIFRDNVINLVQAMEFNKQEASKHLFNMSRCLSPKVVSDNGQITEAETNSETPTFINENVVKEIISLLFSLPNSVLPRIYYEALLLQICKYSTKATAPTFGKYFRIFYQNLDILDYESTITYEEWFRVQLTNFGFTWKWDEWIRDAERFREQMYNPRRMFQINLLRRLSACTSNTYDLRTKLPFVFQDHLDTRYFGSLSMAKYLDVQFRMDKTICNTYDAGLIYLQTCFPFSGEVYRILAYMQNRENDQETGSTHDQLGQMIGQIQDSYTEFFRDFEAFKIVLVIQCVCHCGKRSLSHVINYISRMESRISAICRQSRLKQTYKEFIILDSILRYFNNNSRTGFIIINSFKHLGFVTDSIVLEFLFVEIDKGIRVITNYDARQHLLVMLESYASLKKIEGHLFVKAYRLTLLIIKQALDDLHVSKDMLLNIEECKGKMEDQEFENPQTLDKLNNLWKYFEGLKLIKFLLRKFSVVYKQLSHILLGFFRKICLTHVQTIDIVTDWVEECNTLG